MQRLASQLNYQILHIPFLWSGRGICVSYSNISAYQTTYLQFSVKCVDQDNVLETTLISLSTQYEWNPLYFHISNVSHRHRLIPTHCTNAVPPAAYVSLHNHSLTLCIQVMLFAQYCYNTGQSFHDLGHFQQFRRHLIEPAATHMQWRSQNLVKPAPPPYNCGDIVVLFIVLYCIRMATVSHLTCPVTGTTSHMTHRAAWLSSQVASLYSAVALYH